MTHWFEDMPPGFRFGGGPVEIGRDDITGFAGDWDPQPFHLDEAAARETHFGGLVASGWHTLLIGFRLSIGAGIWNAASMGASGMDEVRFLRPVFPGDLLRLEAEVVSAEPSRSRPDRGRLRIRHDILNQHGERVASFIGNHLMKRRPD